MLPSEHLLSEGSQVSSAFDTEETEKNVTGPGCLEVQERFVVDTVVLGQIFPISIIPLMLQTSVHLHQAFEKQAVGQIQNTA